MDWLTCPLHLRRPGESEGHTDGRLLRLSEVPSGFAAPDVGEQATAGSSRGREGRPQAAAGRYPL